LDKTFYGMVLGAAAGYTLLLLIIIVYAIGDGSIEIFSFEGLEYFTDTDWNAVYGRDAFGALPYRLGTITTNITFEPCFK
jgi:phosphate transport system permease protein